MTPVPSLELIEKFIALVGRKNALTMENEQQHYTHEARGLFVGKTPLVLKPGNTEEVSQILKLANATGTSIIPQGGHTGLVSGGLPSEDASQIIVSLERMKKIREIDLPGNTMTVDAGAVLQNIQELANANDRLFPLALGAQGSCQIGGNIATNAGGTAVLAYGNMRALVLGLEVVLPNGEIWHGLRKLKKDNTGYDLRDLFIGSEGTLGIVTGAVLKLFPKPRGREVAFAGVASPQAALDLFNIAQKAAGNLLTGFEIMPRVGIEFVVRHIAGSRDPLAKAYPWYVLVEISSGRSREEATAMMEEILSSAYEAGRIKDAAIAQNDTQVREFWAIRETIPEAQKPEGGSIKHDVAVPVHLMPEFLARADAIILREIPNARICSFGHLGDGNIHYNISQPAGDDTARFMARREPINELIHALVTEMGGSISAEHGIGRLKRDLMARTKQPLELELMKSIKNMLDPNGIMNPGKVL